MHVSFRRMRAEKKRTYPSVTYDASSASGLKSATDRTVKRQQCLKATTILWVYWQQNGICKKATIFSLVYWQQQHF